LTKAQGRQATLPVLRHPSLRRSKGNTRFCRDDAQRSILFEMRLKLMKTGHCKILGLLPTTRRAPAYPEFTPNTDHIFTPYNFQNNTQAINHGAAA
jgi:hypothetical protein